MTSCRTCRVPGLIQHEWATHGTCTGLTMDDFFTKVLLARAAVQIPVQISSIAATETDSPAQIEGEFAGANAAFPKGAFRTACRRRSVRPKFAPALTST